MIKIIDLSLPYENNATENSPPSIRHSSHEEGVSRMAKSAGLKVEDFPYPNGMATDFIEGTVHSGTHVDAPLHYGLTSEGRPSKTIDQIPLEWLYGLGVVLDMRHKNYGDEISIKDMQQALEKIDYSIQPGDIVLLHTGADKYWGTDTETYVTHQTGLGVSGLDWLLDQGVRTIGIDAWTLDRPIKAMAQSYRETGDNSYLWASHYHGRTREYFQIEKMANLDALPKPYGFIVSALPCKFKGCTAGWCRAVAIINE